MRIRHLFSSPWFIDEAQTQRAQLLQFTIWSMLVVANSQFFVLLYLLPQYWSRWVADLLAINFTMPPLLFLNRRGRTQLAGILLLVLFTLLVTGRALTSGGIHGPVVLGYVVNVLVAGLLFGAKGGVIAGLVSCLIGLGFVLLEKAGLLPEINVTPSTFTMWVNLTCYLEFVVIFLLLVNHSIRTALKRAMLAETALRRSHDELEMRVQERTAELRTLNNELEAFSYSVSHDLRRPLRAVTGFTDLLMSDFAGDLPADARNLLTLIRDGGLQMNQLIEALLSLSRIDRQPLVPRPVNLTELASQAIKDLQAEQPGRKMDIRVADLPECMGDPALLRQVFVNLLSNAMKYTRTRPMAVIEVGCKIEAEDARTIYFVRDNGAGFDMRYADKLFGVFQRLHSAEQFAGTGVGLSIVRRIIHRHGGKIWAESAVNQGATFYFTLPLPGQKPASIPNTTLVGSESSQG